MHIVVVNIDGRCAAVLRWLGSGTHAFWTALGPVTSQLTDLRRQSIEVNAQEILTKDKVTIRVNILAEYRITDPARSASVVRNTQETLYKLLQLAVRRTLGTRTLDEILQEKVEVDAASAEAIRTEMLEAGVEVGAIALKDVILPGEIREILNQVVAAEKQAQANLIRRREETAATRSLLNTARLMEDSPILLRLKELETLEKLTEKVGSVTVTGGFEGMLDKLLVPLKK
jgi:regulator of protease activity HflC (stomatin/prohibitin superfamily)